MTDPAPCGADEAALVQVLLPGGRWQLVGLGWWQEMLRRAAEHEAGRERPQTPREKTSYGAHR